MALAARLIWARQAITRTSRMTITISSVCLLLLVAFSPLCSAHPQSEDEMARRSESDGSLMALAQFCKVPDDRIRSLASKLAQDTLALAKDVPFKFDSEAYRQHAAAGLKQTRQTLAFVPSTGPAYDSNCEEVLGKVSEKVPG